MSQSEITKNNINEKKWEVTDFKIIKESWDKHKLSDNSILKARVILAGVMLETKLEEIEAKVRAGEKPRLGLNFRTRNIFEIESPIALRGPPDTKQYSNEELKKSITDRDMDFKTFQQSWNVYELENGIGLKLRISIVSVNKTNKFDERGMPVYFIESSIELKADLPEQFKKLDQKTIDPEELTFKPII